MEQDMRRYEPNEEQKPERIPLSDLRQMAERMYGNLVKADVDVAKGIVLLDMEMHADGEAILLEQGSAQADIWGINLYPEEYGTEDFIEFDSIINIRPRQQNRSRGVEHPALQERIRAIVNEAIAND